MADLTDGDKIRKLLERICEQLKLLTPTYTEYMCTKRAAIYLDLSRQTLEIWRCSGGGPKYTKLAQAVRYKKSDLDQFMAERSQHHTTEVKP